MWSEVEGKPVNRERRRSTSKDKAVSRDLKARGAKAETEMHKERSSSWSNTAQCLAWTP